jgi:hypothetical protein
MNLNLVSSCLQFRFSITKVDNSNDFILRLTATNNLACNSFLNSGDIVNDAPRIITSENALIVSARKLLYYVLMYIYDL